MKRVLNTPSSDDVCVYELLNNLERIVSYERDKRKFAGGRADVRTEAKELNIRLLTGV